MFLYASFEATASTLTSCCFVLANNQEELKKLQAELEAKNVTNEFTKNFDNLKCLEYLDMFVKEVLRMHPVNQRYLIAFFRY
jgi:cytochrome P450